MGRRFCTVHALGDLHRVRRRANGIGRKLFTGAFRVSPVVLYVSVMFLGAEEITIGPRSFLHAVVQLDKILGKIPMNGVLEVTIDAKGIHFPGAVAGQATKCYLAMADPNQVPALLQILCPDAADTDSAWCWAQEAREALRKVALYALFDCSPATAALKASDVLFKEKPGAILPTPRPWDHRRAVTIRNYFRRCASWQTLQREAFYLLLKKRSPKERGKLLEQVLASALSPLAVADAALFQQASPKEQRFFLEHGEWPDPRLTSEAAVLDSVRKRFLSERSRIGRGVLRGFPASFFPDLPIFWFLLCWHGAPKERVLYDLLRNAAVVDLYTEFPTWQQFAYLELVNAGRRSAFKRLLSCHQPEARALGAAGILELLFADNTFDESFLDTVLSSQERGRFWNSTLDAPLGLLVLRRLGRDVRPKRPVPRRFLPAIVELCFKGDKPPHVKLEIARQAVSHEYQNSPLSNLGRAGLLLVEAFEEIAKCKHILGDALWNEPEGVRISDVRFLAASGRPAAFGLLLNDPELLRLIAGNEAEKVLIESTRYYGKEALRSVKTRIRVVNEEIRKLFKEAQNAIRKRSEAQRILTLYETGTLSYQKALAQLAALEHTVAIPFLWHVFQSERRCADRSLRLKLMRLLRELEPEIPEIILKTKLLRALEAVDKQKNG